LSFGIPLRSGGGRLFERLMSLLDRRRFLAAATNSEQGQDDQCPERKSSKNGRNRSLAVKSTVIIGSRLPKMVTGPPNRRPGITY